MKKKKKSLQTKKYTPRPRLPRYIGYFPADSCCRNKRCRNAYCIWPDGRNTIRGISCISKLLPTILLGKTDTHTQSHLSVNQKKVGVNHIPVVPGRLDPPAEGKKKSLS